MQLYFLLFCHIITPIITMMERVSLVKVPTGSLAMTGSWTEADEAEVHFGVQR